MTHRCTRTLGVMPLLRLVNVSTRDRIQRVQSGGSVTGVFFHLEIDLLMVDLLPEVTWQASLFAAGSLQSLIILLSQHLPDKRAGREHPGCPERLIQNQF